MSKAVHICHISILLQDAGVLVATRMRMGKLFVGYLIIIYDN